MLPKVLTRKEFTKSKKIRISIIVLIENTKRVWKNDLYPSEKSNAKANIKNAKIYYARCFFIKHRFIDKV